MGWSLTGQSSPSSRARGADAHSSVELRCEAAHVVVEGKSEELRTVCSLPGGRKYCLCGISRSAVLFKAVSFSEGTLPEPEHQ